MYTNFLTQKANLWVRNNSYNAPTASELVFSGQTDSVIFTNK